MENKNLTERVERTTRFLHNGKSIFLTPEYKDGSTIYTVNCAGERLAFGELPLIFVMKVRGLRLNWN